MDDMKEMKDADYETLKAMMGADVTIMLDEPTLPKEKVEAIIKQFASKLIHDSVQIMDLQHEQIKILRMKLAIMWFLLGLSIAAIFLLPR